LHKTDLLAVSLLGNPQLELASELPDGGLFEVAHRKQHPRKPLSGNTKQDVALVLPHVTASPKPPAIGVLEQSSIVAGGHVVGLHAVGVVEQEPELQPVIANHARVWRPARQILLYE